MRTTIALTALILAAACSTPPDPAPSPPSISVAPPPAPRPSVSPTPVRTGSWEDIAATPGDWAYRRDSRGSIALFGSDDANAVFAIRCDAGRKRIYLTRAGQLSPSETGTMTIRASSGLQQFPALNTGGGTPLVGAELEPGDTHLDAMAYSRGRFLVSVTGTPDLIIPSWPEFGRVVEDCRG